MEGKQAFALEIPERLKYQPKNFWGMIKHGRDNECHVEAAKFAQFNT